MPSHDLVLLGDVNTGLVLRGGNVRPAVGQAEHLVDDASAGRPQGSTS